MRYLFLTEDRLQELIDMGPTEELVNELKELITEPTAFDLTCSEDYKRLYDGYKGLFEASSKAHFELGAELQEVGTFE